jgi:hypothetical protein
MRRPLGVYTYANSLGFINRFLNLGALYVTRKRDHRAGRTFPHYSRALGRNPDNPQVILHGKSPREFGKNNCKHLWMGEKYPRGEGDKESCASERRGATCSC